MKKILLTSFVVCFGFAGIAATELQETRKNLSKSLSSTVKELKKDFVDIDAKLSTSTSDMKKLKSDADSLVEKSKELELNPTVLEHGQKNIKECADNEELHWDGDSWKCRFPVYGTDCSASGAENRHEDAEGNATCTQPGSYVNESAGYGSCDGTEKTTQIKCMFANSKDPKVKYEVEKTSACKGSVERYKQACGENGKDSSCKCPEGLVYKYNSGNPMCFPAGLVEHISTVRHVAQSRSTTVSVNSNMIHFYSYGPDTRSCRHDDTSVTFNLAKSRVGSASLKFFFKRGGWVSVNGKVVFGFAGFQSTNKDFGSIVSSYKPGYKTCGSSYSGSGYYTLKGDTSCLYSCDMYNRLHSDSYWGDRTHSLSLNLFKEGQNVVRFHRIWGNTGERDYATFRFKSNGKDEELASALPECKITE